MVDVHVETVQQLNWRDNSGEISNLINVMYELYVKGNCAEFGLVLSMYLVKHALLHAE